MVGRRKDWRHKQGFLALDSEGINSDGVASNRGQKWKKWEDAYIIARSGRVMGGSESSEYDAGEITAEDAVIAAALGRTPSAVRGRRARLKKEGKL